MSFGRAPERVGDRLDVLAHRLEQVDRAARARPDRHLAHVHVRAASSKRAALADRDHRHGAVAAARDDAAALERIEREIDLVPAGADRPPRREAASPPPTDPITTRPSIGKSSSTARIAWPASRSAASWSARPSQRAAVSAAPSVTRTYCSQRQRLAVGGCGLSDDSSRSLRPFRPSDPLYLFGAGQDELERRNRSPRACRCCAITGTRGARPAGRCGPGCGGCRRAGRCTWRAGAGRRGRRRAS